MEQLGGFSRQGCRGMGAVDGADDLAGSRPGGGRFCGFARGPKGIAAVQVFAVVSGAPQALRSARPFVRDWIWPMAASQGVAY